MLNSTRRRPARPLALLLLLGAPAAAQEGLAFGAPHPLCPPAVSDATGQAGCLRASSVPQLGMLHPLSQDLFVDPAGQVGLGTITPGVHLEVQGPGGPGSTLRLLTTGATGSGALVLERPGGTPAHWELTFDPGTERDLLLLDQTAGQERLRVDALGTVRVSRLDVGNAAAGLQFRPGSSNVSMYYGPAGAGGSTLMSFNASRIQCSRVLDMSYGAELGTGTSIQFGENDLFGGSPPMIYMFEDGTSNFDRMVLAHSSTFDDWGLRYDDNEDAFHFLGGGYGVMTVQLATGGFGKVGIGDATPSNILQIRQNSATDPIADAWTTYSSRRWKDDIVDLEGALDLVRRLRGVRYTWKATGERDLGLIAEEVGEVLPELVAYEENGTDAQSVDYARLSAVLVAALQEQDARISSLVERVAALEAAADGR